MLIVISHSDIFENEKYFIEKFLNEGADYFHLRKPALSESELEMIINDIPDYLLPKITIHNHYDLLKKFNIGGIHFTAVTKNRIIEFEDSGLRKSISCHSFEDVNNVPDNFNYCFLSPVFNSLSKTNYDGKFNDGKTKSFLSKSFPFDIIALGGITEENISEVIDLGFDGAAMLGRIWENPSNVNLIKEMKKYV